MALNPASDAVPEYRDVLDIDLLRTALRSDIDRRIAGLAIPYPSRNRWLLEEFSLWMALGEHGGLSFSRFDEREVGQGGEPLDAPIPAGVWHYFSSNQAAMELRVGLRAELARAGAV